MGECLIPAANLRLVPKANNRDRCLYEDPPGTWWVRIYDPTTGRRIRRKAGSKTLAREIATAIQNDILRRKNGLPTETRITVGELLDRYQPEWARKRSAADDDRYARMVCEEFGGRLWFDLRPADVVAWRTRLLEEPSPRTGRARRPATANRAVSFLRRLFNLALRDDLITRNPAAHVEALAENNTLNRWLRPGDEEERLRAEFSPGDWLICELGIHTGLRAGNLFGLRRQDLDLGQALLRVPETKHGGHHDLPLTARAVAIFGQLLAAHDSPWVFPSPRNAARPRNYDAWYHRVFAPACARAGLRLRFHDLRHTFGSRLVAAGVPIYDVGALLGHKSLEVTKRYAHLAPERLRESVRKLDQQP